MTRLAVLVLALTACYTPKAPAERPRALVYNALCIAGGIAAGVLGYESYEHTKDSDIAFTELDLEPTH